MVAAKEPGQMEAWRWRVKLFAKLILMGESWILSRELNPTTRHQMDGEPWPPALCVCVCVGVWTGQVGGHSGQ